MRKHSHSVTELHLHIVLVTKFRKPLLTGEIDETVKRECRRILEHYECRVEEMETDKDHIHILMEMPPKYSVMQIVNVLKGVSSRMVRKEHGEEIEKMLKHSSFWSPSYYAGTTGGVTLETVKRYVEAQRQAKPWEN